MSTAQCDLRLGRWQDALSDVDSVDAVITDPPYSARTHGKQRHGRRDAKKEKIGAYVSARGIGYEHWSPGDVRAFVDAWAPRCRGWFCALTDSELIPSWIYRYRHHGLTTFAPVPCVMKGMNVRLAGDGPSSWSVWLVVARPKALAKWGTLQGAYTPAYVGLPIDEGETLWTSNRRSSVVGSKPMWLMQAIIRDYTLAGDLVCDPCSGGGTTLLAALTEGRRALGAEVDPKTHAFAMQRLAVGYTPPLFPAAAGGAT